MRRTVAILMLLIAPACAVAEIVDRIAAIVGTTILTSSDVLRQIRLTALLNGADPVYSPKARREAAQMLVEQALIRREMGFSSGGAAASTTADPELVKLLEARYPTEDAYQAALRKYEVTDAEVKAQLLWQTQLVQFVDQRFRPALPPTEAELRDYYESTFVPDWTSSREGKPPAFDAAREEVERQAMAQLANNALDRWLGQTRTQTRIRLMPEAFK
jgi:hypothetical protein